MGRSSWRCSMSARAVALFFGLCGLLSISESAEALPWDTDLFSQQSLKANEVARAPVKGTVPVGHTPFKMTTEEAAAKLKNPVQLSKQSALRGRRLYNANCLTCHGSLGVGNGPVGPLMAVPNITTDAYANKADGSIYGAMMNGGSNMPRYGYKFSEAERWDIVNYVRFLQGRDVAGLERK